MSEELDDVETPSLLFREMAAADIGTPAAGQQRPFIDSTTHRETRKSSSGATRDIELEQAVVTADPAAPNNDRVWFFDDGGSPPTLLVKWRRGGVTYGPFPIGQAI